MLLVYEGCNVESVKWKRQSKANTGFECVPLKDSCVKSMGKLVLILVAGAVGCFLCGNGFMALGGFNELESFSKYHDLTVFVSTCCKCVCTPLEKGV